MKKIILSLLVCITILTGCSVLGNDDTEVEIRVKNSSTYTIESLRISTGGGDHTYETLAPGEISTYKAYDFSYSYFFTSFSIDTNQFVQQPIDYVGESKIKGGRYTFDITVETFEGRPIHFTGDLKKN